VISKFGRVLYINMIRNTVVKFPFLFHNPQTKRYALYYSIILVVATATVLFTTLEYIHQTAIQGIAHSLKDFSLCLCLYV